MEADFGGWATKANLKCTDGRIIMPGAFEHMDKMQVPLVWQHGHSNSDNILGHAILENRKEGVYAYAFFNGTTQGKNAKEFVQHGDIKFLSIYANNLLEKGKNVVHGMIREVSLVLAGANPGAVIDFVSLAHGDGSSTDLDDEAILKTGLEIEIGVKHSDDSGQGSAATDDQTGKTDDGQKTTEDKNLEHADDQELTTEEVWDSMTPVQQQLSGYLIAVAAGQDPNATATHSDDNKNDEGDLSHLEGADDMSRNVFDQTDSTKNGGAGNKNVLSHGDVKEIIGIADDCGSLKKAVELYALKHGITSIETLFPDSKTLSDQPEFNKRRTEWVPGVLNGVRRSPFSRVKTIMADITMDEARAKGYIKGDFKKEEWFGVTKRTTTPTTVYKKQQLDRDDIIDITDFDVVAWIRAEMRMMLEEEIARSILIGDGRDISSDDKIKDPMAASDGAGIRSILHEHELYAATVNVSVAGGYLGVVEDILRARRLYKGTGTPTLYTTNQTLVEMLLTKDEMGRRYWANKAELAAAMMVSDIVEVESMEEETGLVGIIVNLADYNVGADKGGEVSLFDDFDIDYNQYKYLIETRISGALVKLKSALIITNAAGALVDPLTAPTFNDSTFVVTIPTQTGVVYKNKDTSATLTAGAQTALSAGTTLNVIAVPASGSYHFRNNIDDEWSFSRPSA